MKAAFKLEKPIPVSFYPLALLTLLAVVLSIYRLVVGLGPTTNMSDHYPWGLWITTDLFLIPLAGAAFTISLITYFFGRGRYHTVIRPAVLAGFLGYGVVGVLLFLDIGRWPQFYNIFVPGFMNVHSFLEEVSLCITLYTVILVLEIAPVFLEKYNLQGPIRWINSSIYWIAGAGIILSTLHQIIARIDVPADAVQASSPLVDPCSAGAFLPAGSLYRSRDDRHRRQLGLARHETTNRPHPIQTDRSGYVPHAGALPGG